MEVHMKPLLDHFWKLCFITLAGIVGSVTVGLFPDGAAWLPPAP